MSVGKTHEVHAGSFHLQTPVGKSFGDKPGWDHFTLAPADMLEDQFYDIFATTQACESLKRLAEREGPFAMFLGFHSPHEPYIMPERYLDFLKPQDVPLPAARCEGEYESKAEAYRRRVDLFKRKFGEVDEEMFRKGIAGYFCLLKLVDDCLGRVLATMRELGLMENTLIVFTSDHGDVLGEHWIFNKAATFHEGEARIPFLVRFPDGAHASTRVGHLASSLDFVPTLLEILGVEADVSLPGMSLMPMIERDEKLRDAVTCATREQMMIRTETHKLWLHAELGDGEMYDLTADPMELDNLYGRPEYAALQAELTDRMLRERMRDDMTDNTNTAGELRIRDEAKVTYEPEI